MSSKIYIHYSIGDGAVIMDWDGYATSEQFREGSLLMLDLVKKHSAAKVLADAKDMILIGRDDQIWTVETLIPQLVGAGCYTVAIVSPHSYFNQVAMETISFKAQEKSLTCKLFHNIEAAVSWLRNVDL